jgi:hypothetical protein
MALSTAARIRVLLDLVETNTAAGVQERSSVLTHAIEYDSGELASGTASNQQDRVWSDLQSVTAGTPDTWDLAGTLTSELSGATVTFVEITGIWIRNKSTTTAQILEIGAGSNPLLNFIKATGDAIQVGPGGVLLLTSPVDGFAVTANTGDVLTITSASGTIAYEIAIWGRSA